MMTPQETNRRIAAHLGWTPAPDGRYTMDPAGLKGPFIHDLPDFCASLDCMHTAEATLTDEQHSRFRAKLWEITECGDHTFEGHKWNRAYCSAPASIRAAAFLKVVSALSVEQMP